MKSTFKLLSFCTTLVISASVFAQTGGVSVSEAANDPASTAILDVKSVSKGVLLPRMSGTQRTAISSPAHGLMVFDNTDKAIFYYDSTATAWRKLSQSAFTLSGSDAYYSSGNVGIGTTSPSASLHVSGSTIFDATAIFNNTGADRDFRIEGDTDTSLFSVDASVGRIGIRTIAPSASFHINDGSESTTKTNFTQALSSAGLLISTELTTNAYTPGLFWSTSNDNITRPKAGIYLQEGSTGTKMIFGTSNAYSTGITSEGLIIDKEGNIGVNTSSPSANLHVNGTSSFDGVAVFNNGNSSTYDVRIEGANDTTLFLTDADINKVFIGTSFNTSAKLNVMNGNFRGISVFNTASDNSSKGAMSIIGARKSNSNVPFCAYGTWDNGTVRSLYMGGGGWGMPDATEILFHTALAYNETSDQGIERMRLTNRGRLGIGLTNPTYQLQLSTDSAAKSATSTWFTTSDQRLKRDVRPFTEGLEVLKQINPVEYKYTGQLGTPNDNVDYVGILAQELEQVAPYMIGTSKRTGYAEDFIGFEGQKNLIRTESVRSVNAEGVYGEVEKEVYETEIKVFNAHSLFFILINSVKELETENDELRTQLQQLTTRVQTLENN